MKVICDLYIPFRLVSFFKQAGIAAEHLNNLPDGFYTTDKAIADYADKNELVVISKDIDFRNGYFINRSPQRLIRICLGKITTVELIAIFEKQLDFLKITYNSYPNFYLELNKSSSFIINF